MAHIRTDRVDFTTIPNPPIGQFVIAYDIVDDILKQKDSAGVLTPIAGNAGSALPIIHYVYLVNDTSDAILMGGVASNVFTNTQLAYNKAIDMVIASAGTIDVVIKVGVTTAAVVGGYTGQSNPNYANKISFAGIITFAIT